LSGETRSFRAGRREIPRDVLLKSVKEIPESAGNKEKMDGTVEAEVLCSYDAEDVQKIVGGVRRVGDFCANFRLPALNWRTNSLRLRINGSADDSWWRVRLDVQEWEVIRGVVGKPEKFAGLKRRQTAK
jgi:hypothetical protein